MPDVPFRVYRAAYVATLALTFGGIGATVALYFSGMYEEMLGMTVVALLGLAAVFIVLRHYRENHPLAAEERRALERGDDA